jgi:hypothetical protein
MDTGRLRGGAAGAGLVGGAEVLGPPGGAAGAGSVGGAEGRGPAAPKAASMVPVTWLGACPSDLPGA